jgi:hypothetical protein
MRKAGVAVPKYELRNQGEARGELSVVDTRENHLNRVVKLARLVCSPGDKQHVYTLYEPHLLWMNEDRFVLTGFEHLRHGDQAVDYAQSWLCIIDTG